MDQNVYQMMQMCPCFRRILRADEQLNSKTALRVLEKSYRRRQTHASVSLLEDRFVLRKKDSRGKEPFRSWLGYSEITDIQRGRRHPEFLVLSVQSANSRNKYYEVYKFKTEAEAREFERTVKEALANPEHRIRGGEAIGHETIREGTQRSRFLSHLEFQTLLDSSDEEYRSASMCELLSPTPPKGFEFVEEKSPSRVSLPAYEERYVQTAPLRTYSPPPKIKEPQVIIREPQMVIREEPIMVKQSVPIARAPQPAPVVTTVEPAREVVVKAPPPPKPSGSEGVTYIKFDPRTQNPSVAENGPVYMFTSRNNDPVPINGHEENNNTAVGYNANRTQYQNYQNMRNGGHVFYEYAS
ncbi:unnamed protein product [Calicophoron daubneyi]|uniref:Trematode PH-like domain-containing protein n=1 Tax=Calicophoron daubneyi TaxID=300641 RepID=A0AAV2TKZ4_CALDB